MYEHTIVMLLNIQMPKQFIGTLWIGEVFLPPSKAITVPEVHYVYMFL